MNEEFPFERFLGSSPSQGSMNGSTSNTKGNPMPKELVNLQLKAWAQKNDLIDPSQRCPIKFLKQEGHQYIIECTDPDLTEIINNNFLQSLQDLVMEITGKVYVVEITSKELHRDFSEKSAHGATSDARFSLNLSPTRDDLDSRVESTYLKHIDQSSYGINIDERKVFSNYIVGPSNNMAYASCYAASKNPGKAYPSIYIHSKSGLGKTHLLHSVANFIKEDKPHLRVCLTTAQNFLQELVESMKMNLADQFRKKYTETIDVLMIDDIHELKNKQATQNAFFHIFNELYSRGKQLIFTSDKNPKEIDGIEERIRTRLSWGLVVDIQQPDYETRVAILRRKAQEEDIYFPDEVIYLIASSIKDNIRELEGSLIKLAAYASIFKIDIDVEIAKQELRLEEKNQAPKITMESIAKATSSHFKVPLVDLKSKSRLKEVTHSRHVAMYLSYRLLNVNLQEIGKFYGNRDHTSVLHGVNRIKDSLVHDAPLAQSLLEIEHSLG